MPVRIHDARRLADLAGDQRQLLVGQPTDVDLDRRPDIEMRDPV